MNGAPRCATATAAYGPAAGGGGRRHHRDVGRGRGKGGGFIRLLLSWGREEEHDGGVGLLREKEGDDVVGLLVAEEDGAD